MIKIKLRLPICLSFKWVGAIYKATTSGRLYCLNSETFFAEAISDSYLTAPSGTIPVTNSNGYLRKLDASALGQNIRYLRNSDPKSGCNPSRQLHNFIRYAES